MFRGENTEWWVVSSLKSFSPLEFNHLKASSPVKLKHTRRWCPVNVSLWNGLYSPLRTCHHTYASHKDEQLWQLALSMWVAPCVCALFFWPQLWLVDNTEFSWSSSFLLVIREDSSSIYKIKRTSIFWSINDMLLPYLLTFNSSNSVTLKTT